MFVYTYIHSPKSISEGGRTSEVGKRGWINGVPAKCPEIARKSRIMFMLMQFNTC